MIGSARPLIAWASALLVLLCVTIAVVTWRANGVLILAVCFLSVFAWSVDAFSPAAWFADEETSRRLETVDQELDFIEDVRIELQRLGAESAPMLAERIPVASRPVLLSELAEARAARVGAVAGAVAGVIAAALFVVGLVIL